ncbi:MAG: ABC transporter permease [Chloroflexi bacterium]|nr:ABC transporter permease [Chloroflexota bacterium]
MRRISSFLVRIFSFLSKELIEILRQPKLILTLILGPFLILLLFGIGYTNQRVPERTLFVLQQDNPFNEQIQSKLEELDYVIDLVGTTDDFELMISNLHRNAIDLGVVIPDNVYETISSNQQSTIEIYHNQIDPNQVAYAEYMGSFLAQSINRQLIQSVAEEGQTEAENIAPLIASALEDTRNTRLMLEQGDVISAQRHQREVRRNLSTLQVAVRASASLLQGVSQTFGGVDRGEADILKTLQATRDNPAIAQDIKESQDNYDEQIAALKVEEENLLSLQQQLESYTSISPAILIRPFVSKIQAISQTEISPTNFFIPGVIVLLLQHMTITLSSLSLVRERRAGTMELFRVSPLKPIEILFSKYFSYMFIGLLIAAILILAVRYGLNSTMLGSWLDLLIIVVLLLFASLGIGFIISFLSQTETQSVQLSMIALLFSVFFSGFFLDLRYLLYPVRYISYLIPATYGTQTMQNVMLRGMGIQRSSLVNLTIFGVILFVLAWVFLRRAMAHE